MRSKAKARDQNPLTYRLIHSKNSLKRLSTDGNEKNSEYFPTKAVKRQIENHYLDSSSATYSNKDYSQSSRGTLLDSTSVPSLKQENKMLKKQVKRLSKEMLLLQKMMLEKQDKTATLKKLETELEETYRAIQYYQSKVKQLEMACKDYQQSLNTFDFSSSKTNKISELLEKQRNENIELFIQLDKKDKLINQMTFQIGNLSLKQVENEYQIKNLEKQKQSKKKTLQKEIKFIDDYEQEHLIISKSTTNLNKKRGTLLKSKKIVKASGESSEEDSLHENEYKSNFYLKKRKLKGSTSDRDSSPNTSALKATMYGNINSKINNIEREVEGLKKQNQKLNKDLNSKEAELLKMKTSNQQLEMKVILLQQIKNKQKGQPEQTHTLKISKDKLKQIPKPSPSIPPVSPASQNSENKLSMFVSNINRSSNFQPNSNLQDIKPSGYKKEEKSSYKRIHISDLTLKKLLVNVIKSDLTYEDLLANISSCWSGEQPKSLIEFLEDSPCSLSSQEISEFMLQYQQIIKYLSGRQSQEAKKDISKQQYQKYLEAEIKKILQKLIPSFKNITFRRQFTINIQLSNKFKNYEEQFRQLVKKYENKMPLKECEEILVGSWGMSEEEFICLLVKNNQESGSIQSIQIADLGNFYLTD